MIKQVRKAWRAAVVLQRPANAAITRAICALKGWPVPWFAKMPSEQEIATARDDLRAWRDGGE